MPANPAHGVCNHLAGPRLYLDALTADDGVAVAAWHRDGRFLRHLDADPATPPAADALTAGWTTLKTAGGFPFAVRTQEEDPRLVGIVALDEVLWAQRGGVAGDGDIPNRVGSRLWPGGAGSADALCL